MQRAFAALVSLSQATPEAELRGQEAAAAAAAAVVSCSKLPPPCTTWSPSIGSLPCLADPFLV